MKKVGKMSAFVLSIAMSVGAGIIMSGCGHTHELSRLKGKAATCTETGILTHYRCDGCGKLFADEKGENEITLQDTVAALLPHDTVRHDAAAEGYEVSNGLEEYWKCSVCGKLFGEQSARTEITLSKLNLPMFIDRTFYATGTENGPDVFSSTAVEGNYDVISGPFVLRFFIGFNYEPDTLNGRLAEVHMNVHREGATPDWWQFLFIHDSGTGKTIIRYGNNGHKEISLSDAFNRLVKDNGGLYLLFVRNGDSVALYAEDEGGQPQKIGDITGFSEGAVYRMRIAHFEGYFADETHGGVIKDMTIAMNTNDINAERSNPVKKEEN